MTTTRFVDQHTGTVAEGAPTLLPAFAEIDTLRADLAKVTEERDDARAEVDHLTLLLKDSGSHVANLASGLAMYQVERDEYRERCDEYRDQLDEARTQIDELKDELAEVKRQLEWEAGK